MRLCLFKSSLLGLARNVKVTATNPRMAFRMAATNSWHRQQNQVVAGWIATGVQTPLII